MRIAIVRLSSLGDVIVSASVLPFVKKHLEEIYPQRVEIDWIVDSTFSEVLYHSPCIDNLIEINLKKGGVNALPTIIKNLKALPVYDILIDMQGLIKSALCGSMLKNKQYWGFAWDSIKEPLASLVYTYKVRIPYEQHILERNLKLVCSALGFKDIDETNRVYYHNRAEAFGVSEVDNVRVLEIFRAFEVDKDAKNIVLILESSLEAKTYPLHLFVQVIQQLLETNPYLNVFLLWHSTNKAQKIKEHFASQKNVVVLPRLHMGEIKALIQKVDLLIGGDTGITHLAWAMQKDSITLYGNTPAARFALQGKNNRFLSGSENPSYAKNDFSIANIQPNAICACAEEILYGGSLHDNNAHSHLPHKDI
ncbi:lipopolysaccharide heptosyltransferase I [Helicobacter sp. MIT 03-1614]|jgi:heptosyltransferase-1|uniref:Lipopolysaccharide heptosyltransferase 1 n=1 Tax=Helicobacter hepaticus (strain ATCC 51449 / 3B1) TaxID=235279 RepID=Q7VHI4_HELHP|nr:MULTISPECIES: lipopolysaccharide heptosyltransferase I [Helicobacter]AAP77580.1 lipopolysaccharide heptosyltransferase [Helicobacter hepaticus ATCC 51449]TLD88060.1 lipopolysaccharide heptosyltransferase I [Helicobacter sp. MIT 03-1614]